MQCRISSLPNLPVANHFTIRGRCITGCCSHLTEHPKKLGPEKLIFKRYPTRILKHHELQCKENPKRRQNQSVLNILIQPFKHIRLFVHTVSRRLTIYDFGIRQKRIEKTEKQLTISLTVPTTLIRVLQNLVNTLMEIASHGGPIISFKGDFVKGEIELDKNEELRRLPVNFSNKGEFHILYESETLID